jgi:hypothetical protein
MPFLVDQNFKPPIQYWLEYTTTRGLKPETLQAAGVQFLDAATLSKNYGNWTLINGPVGAAVIPADGQPTCDFKKFRFFFPPQAVPPVKDKKPAKYKRQAGMVNTLYIPPILTDWYTAEYDLIITEGELASLRLAQDGYHAVAIGGVENFRIADKTTGLIPELRKLVQAKNVKSVIIAHDSDVAERPKLQLSLNRLAAELSKHRRDKAAGIFICLPKNNPDGSKNGPDDYLQAHGIDEFNRLLREEREAFSAHPELQQELLWVDRVIYNRVSGLFYDHVIRKEVPQYQINNNMAQGSELVSLNGKIILYDARNYLRSPSARIADGAKYNPAHEEEYYLDPRDGKHYINLFNPEDIPKPVKGDVSLFYTVLEKMSPNSPVANRKIVTVAAQHAQCPTTNPLYGLVFVGEQGSGKSLMAQLIGTSLSKRYHSARVDLTSGFNANWRGYACKEWPEFDRNMDAEWLKDLITSSTLDVNAKHQAGYVIDNYTLNIFTANQMKSVVQEGDRRMIISGWGHRLDPQLGLEFYEWVNGPGPSYLRYHLLYEVSAQEYAKMGSLTESRTDVIEASKSYKSSVMDLILDELSIIEGLECVPNYILESLLEKYKVNTISFNKEFGHVFIKPSKEVVKIDGTPQRFRAFKNHEKWRKEASIEEYRIQAKLADQLLKMRKF